MVKHIYSLVSFSYDYGFIDHSFEERRKILKGKQREESIINFKLILYIRSFEHSRNQTFC